MAVISFSSFSGGKCKFDYDKKDEFSGKAVRWTKYTLYKKYADYATTLELLDYSFQLGDNSGQFYFETDLTIYNDARNFITETDSIMLKLDDGKIISVAPNKSYPAAPRLYNGNKIVVSDYMPIFNISKAKMKKLAESPIVAIRFSIDGKTYSVKPKEGKTAKIMEVAGCLLSDD